MKRRILQADVRGYFMNLVTDLIKYGWTIHSIPENGKLVRNGLKLVLRTAAQEYRVRMFIYKVTTSGRGKPHERRVEITTTYGSGLRRESKYRDVVLGKSTNIYVGIDRKRLHMGGATHNASSFFDQEGLSVKTGELLITPRAVMSAKFPARIENHAFFRSDRLAEYLLNHEEIHRGTYSFHGGISRPTLARRTAAPRQSAHPAQSDAVILSLAKKSRLLRTKISKTLLDAAEKRDFSKLKRTAVTPEQLRQLLMICEEIGTLGELAVLAEERKRLRNLGFRRQADTVERVSLRSVSEGFDILSYEDDGVTRRYLEVKATSGSSMTVDMSTGEWRAARQFKDSYHIVRVTRVRTGPQFTYVRNPSALVESGLIKRTEGGWRLDLRKVVKRTR